jgi:hypothetical protein
MKPESERIDTILIPVLGESGKRLRPIFSSNLPKVPNLLFNVASLNIKGDPYQKR